MKNNKGYEIRFRDCGKSDSDFMAFLSLEIKRL